MQEYCINLNNMKKNVIGKHLKELRKEKGLTERQLGNLLNFSNQTISAWENGTREPTLDALIAIADIFEVSTDELLGRKDY